MRNVMLQTDILITFRRFIRLRLIILNEITDIEHEDRFMNIEVCKERGNKPLKFISNMKDKTSPLHTKLLKTQIRKSEFYLFFL